MNHRSFSLQVDTMIRTSFERKIQRGVEQSMMLEGKRSARHLLLEDEKQKRESKRKKFN